MQTPPKNIAKNNNNKLIPLEEPQLRFHGHHHGHHDHHHDHHGHHGHGHHDHHHDHHHHDHHHGGLIIVIILIESGMSRKT